MSEAHYERLAAALGLGELRPLVAWNPDLRPRFRRGDRRFDYAGYRRVWRRLLAAGGDAARVALYVHVPFCRTLCDFCRCSTVAAGSAVIERYLDYVCRQAEYLAPTFAGHAPSCYMIGGGTPSVLTAGQLDRLLGRIGRSFAVAGLPRFCSTIELAFGTVDAEKVAVLGDHGFRRASLGVQSREPGVLRRSHRPVHPRARLEADLGLLRRRFEWINLDLVLGMEGETSASFRAGVEELFALEPDSVVVHLLTESLGGAPGVARAQPAERALRLASLRRSLDHLRAACARRGWDCVVPTGNYHEVACLSPRAPVRRDDLVAPGFRDIMLGVSALHVGTAVLALGTMCETAFPDRYKFIHYDPALEFAPDREVFFQNADGIVQFFQGSGRPRVLADDGCLTGGTATAPAPAAAAAAPAPRAAPAADEVLDVVLPSALSPSRHMPKQFLPAAYIVTGNRCTFSCVFCSVDGGPARHLRPVAEVEASLQAALGRGLRSIIFIGGEPTAHPELPALVARARAAGARPIRLFTNGLGLADPAAVDALVRAGLDGVMLSLHDHRPAVVRSLSRSPAWSRRFQEVTAGLLGRRDLSVWLFRLILGNNLDALEGYLDWLAALKPPRRRVPLTLSLLMPRGRVRARPDLYLALPAIRARLPGVVARARRLGIDITFDHAPGCLYPEEPERVMDIYGRLQQVSLRTGAATPGVYAEDYRYTRACARCGLAGACPGLRAGYFELFPDVESWVVPIAARRRRPRSR